MARQDFKMNMENIDQFIEHMRSIPTDIDSMSPQMLMSNIEKSERLIGELFR